MKTRVVIEFSERWLKVVVAAPSGIKHSRVKKIILQPLEADVSNISAPLAQVFKQIGQRKGLEVTVCLSRNKITVRRLDLPSREPGELEQMLALHVIRQVPYPKEEIIWGYQNLGFDGIGNSHILLAIAHRQMLKDIFNAFTSLNILPQDMLMSSQGVIHYLYDSLKDKSLLAGACLVLDIDYNFSEFMLVNNQCLRSSVVISQGSEQLKLEPDRAKFGAELKQALAVFNNEIPNIKPARLFLTGAAFDALSPVEDYLAKDFNLKFQFVKSPETENLSIKDSGGLSFAAALGFTYQRKKEDINFTLPEAQIKKEIKLKTRQLLIMGVCLTYILILLGVMALVRLNQLQSYRDKLNARIVQLKRDTGGLFDIAQKISIASQYVGAKQSIFTYIYELSRICPDNITLTNFTWEWQKNFTLRGYASQMQDIFNFVNALDASELFKGAQTQYTRRRKIKDKEAVDFEIAKK